MTAHQALAELVQHASAVGRTAFLGLVGPPGVGKSYAAARVAATLRGTGISAAVLPMDGFHLSNHQLQRLGLRASKGVPETFDVAGFLALIERIASGPSEPVYCPDYDRELHEPIAGRIRIEPGTQVVVTEGNYLLLDGAWRAVRERLDRAWYLEAPAALREQRLIARHSHERTAAEAREWVRTVDEPNAELIATTRSRADVAIDSRTLDAQLAQFAQQSPTQQRMNS